MPYLIINHFNFFYGQAIEGICWQRWFSVSLFISGMLFGMIKFFFFVSSLNFYDLCLCVHFWPSTWARQAILLFFFLHPPVIQLKALLDFHHPWWTEWFSFFFIHYTAACALNMHRKKELERKKKARADFFSLSSHSWKGK